MTLFIRHCFFAALAFSAVTCGRPLPPCCGGVPELVCVDAAVPVDRAVVDEHTCAVACFGVCCQFGTQSRAVCDNTGACAILCFSGGFIDCDGDPANGCEINVSSDPRNCGACGNRCQPGERCEGQFCRP